MNVERLANVMGLDINNKQHTVAIIDAFYGVVSKEDFIEYCRNNKDGIEYATKTEKLDTLATRYKRELEREQLADKLKDGEKYSEHLAQKVKQTQNIIEEKSCMFRDIRLNGDRYFADHELRALASIGSTSAIIELSRLGKLADAVYDLYADKIQQKAKTGNNSIASITKKAIKRI